MKRTICLIALSSALTAGTVSAQMMAGDTSGMMQGHQQQNPSQSRQQDYPNMMYPGMMGGYGYGMSPQMMGFYGRQHGMMQGYGMGPGMMGGYGPGEEQPGSGVSENFKKFLDETKEFRKELHILKFEYGEMLRNPDSTMKKKMDMEKEMFELQQKIQEKAGE
jgi:hypothetical protein